jgi:hypothetical protein
LWSFELAQLSLRYQHRLERIDPHRGEHDHRRVRHVPTVADTASRARAYTCHSVPPMVRFGLKDRYPS